MVLKEKPVQTYDIARHKVHETLIKSAISTKTSIHIDTHMYKKFQKIYMPNVAVQQNV